MIMTNLGPSVLPDTFVIDQLIKTFSTLYESRYFSTVFKKTATLHSSGPYTSTSHLPTPRTLTHTLTLSSHYTHASWVASCFVLPGKESSTNLSSLLNHYNHLEERRLRISSLDNFLHTPDTLSPAVTSILLSIQLWNIINGDGPTTVTTQC